MTAWLRRRPESHILSDQGCRAGGAPQPGAAGEEESCHKVILTGGGGPGIHQASPDTFPETGHLHLIRVLVVFVVFIVLGSQAGSQEEATTDQQHHRSDNAGLGFQDNI